MKTKAVVQILAIAGAIVTLSWHNTVVNAEAQATQFRALLYLPFNGNVAAAIPAGGMKVTEVAQLKFAEGKCGQAADFRNGGCVEYRGLPAINTRSGTLELWVKGIHERRQLEDHFYLQFLGENDAPLIELFFYHTEQSFKVNMRAGGGIFSRYGWAYNKDHWMHIVVAWESVDPDQAGLHLYLNGVVSGYPATYGNPIPTPVALRVGCKSSKGDLPASALIDEVCVYNRCLSAMQVKLLHSLGGQPLEQKTVKVRESIARDEAIRRERKDALFNHRKLAILHGWNTSLDNWKSERFAQIGIPVPDPIRDDQLAKTDLSRYDALIVPGGGGLNLADPDKEALLRYVRQGGGYVGICGGAVTAKTYGLIRAESYLFAVRGPVFVTLKPHPITEGYDLARPLLFPHASGPLFVVHEKSEEPLIVFEVGNPPLPPFTHTIVKQLGKGRIVAFSGHPEGSSETRPLLRNAVLWATKVTGNEDAGKQADAKEDRR